MNAVDFVKAYNNISRSYMDVLNKVTSTSLVVFHNKNFDTILFKFKVFAQPSFEYYIATYTSINRISKHNYLKILTGWRKDDALIKTHKQVLTYNSIW